MTAPVVLVTGGAGYVGARVVGALVARGLEVVATRRPGQRPPVVPGAPGAPGAGHAVAELGSPDPFGVLPGALVRRITAVVHAGGVTRFDTSRAAAERANVAGTRQVLELARRCPRLESLVVLSSVYATGLRSGRIAQAPPSPTEPAAGFANAYEWSKWAAERAVVDGGGGLPWTVARLGTVVADDPSGRVSGPNAFHRTLDLWFHGLLPVLPGDPRARLYLLDARWAAEEIVSLALAPRAGRGGVVHLCPPGRAAPTLGQVAAAVTGRFAADPTFARRVAQVPFVDQRSFAALREAVVAMPGSVLAQAVAALGPFTAQLAVDKDVESTRAPTASIALVAATCDWLVSTRWGRRAVA